VSYKLCGVIRGIDVIVKVQWCVLHSLYSVIFISLMDVNVRVQWCDLQTWCCVIIRCAMDVNVWVRDVTYKLGVV